jgi:hypothetical protein
MKYNRRDFIKTAALGTAALGVSSLLGQRGAWAEELPLVRVGQAVSRATGTVSGTIYVEVNHHGSVDAGAQPLPGVLVSDGTQIVRTDEYGHYTLPLPATGALVRLSIPSNYWPLDNRWFDRVPAADTATCNFTLRPQVQTTPWHMLQVSDIHYFSPAARHLRTFCTQVNALQPAPAFIMATGDLVMESNGIADDHTTRGLFANYTRAMAPLHAPVFNLPGNHDLPGVTGHMPASDPLYGLRGYETPLGPGWYSFNYAGVHVVALYASLVKPGDIRGGFSPECLAWLRADLSLTPPEQPLLVFLHQYPRSWANPEDLQGALAGRKVLGIFTGHSHEVKDYDWAGYPVHEGGALCGYLWLFDCPDGKPRGFRTLTVTSEAVETQYVPAKLPSEAELGLIRRGLMHGDSEAYLGRTFADFCRRL